MSSLDVLRDGVKFSEVLFERESLLPDPPSGEMENESLALRGAIAVLIVSVFENFLHELFLEQVSRLTPRPPVVEFDRLPERLRVTAVFNSLDASMKGPRGGSEKIDRLPEVTRAARLVGAEIIDPVAFSETQSNPGPGTVRQMFGDVGVKDIFNVIRGDFEAAWGGGEANSFISDKLQEIVLRRNSVAHRLDVRRVTRAQLFESILFIEQLGAVLYNKLSGHVDQLLKECAVQPPPG